MHFQKSRNGTIGLVFERLGIYAKIQTTGRVTYVGHKSVATCVDVLTFKSKIFQIFKQIENKTHVQFNFMTTYPFYHKRVDKYHLSQIVDDRYAL